VLVVVSKGVGEDCEVEKKSREAEKLIVDGGTSTTWPEDVIAWRCT
jgi:hypothetical protein